MDLCPELRSLCSPQRRKLASHFIDPFGSRPDIQSRASAASSMEIGSLPCSTTSSQPRRVSESDRAASPKGPGPASRTRAGARAAPPRLLGSAQALRSPRSHPRRMALRRGPGRGRAHPGRPRQPDLLTVALRKRFRPCPEGMRIAAMNKPVALADTARALAAIFAESAAAHDRDASFPFGNFEALREAGLLALTVPADLGGGGAGLVEATSVVNRIAQGEPSTALVLAMHYIQHAKIAKGKIAKGKMATVPSSRRAARPGSGRRPFPHQRAARRARARHAGARRPSAHDRAARRGALAHQRPQDLRDRHSDPALARRLGPDATRPSLGSAPSSCRARLRASVSSRAGTSSACAPAAAMR